MACNTNLFSLLLLVLPLASIAQKSSNISLGSSLSTMDGNNSWISPSGDFAFGFHRLPNKDIFLLAIWYEKIPEKTITWHANGDNPLQFGSKIELKMDGQLVLNDHRGRMVWKPKAVNGSSSGVVSAAMLDTGNFVLRSSDSSPFWQSFNEPTNTILPSQALEFSGKLSSPLTEDRYSIGRFQLRLLPDGNLVLNTIGFPTEKAYEVYYRSDTYKSGYRVVFNESGDISLLRSGGSPFNLMPTQYDPPKDFYYRATLDFDGAFRQYRYPKAHGRSQIDYKWEVISTIPKDMCTSMATNEGSGICGFNSYCKMGSDGRHTCLCPHGFSYFDPNDKYKGCKQNNAVELQRSCELDKSKAREMFEMRELENTDWFLWHSEELRPYNEEQCKEACLTDCLCMVAITRNSGCQKKKLPLSNGRTDPSLGGKALIKVFKGNYTKELSEKKKDRATLIIVGSLLLGSSAFLNFVFLLLVLLGIHFSYHKKIFKLQPNSSILGMNLRSFTYRELEKITQGFKEELGRGGFATVYKGALIYDSQNLAVAVKKMDKVENEDEKVFLSEVSTIGQTHHKNLVHLLGFCDEGPHRLLVYEFMSNGSLATILFGRLRPEWSQRMRIAAEIARGLLYLHEGCSNQIIHCDIKPQNILLDDCLTARISDFGLAKLLKSEWSRTSTTTVRGTRGYMAPEWFKNMKITAKVDVYSFGVVLLEIICCRKNIELEIESEEKAVLITWAYDCYRKGRLDMLVNYDNEALCDGEKLKRLVMVALWCIQEAPAMRPSMKKLTEMIKGQVEVAIPPNPYSFISSLA